MIDPSYEDHPYPATLTKITFEKPEEPKQETACTLFCELLKSLPYAFECWLERVSGIQKKPKHYQPFEYTQTLEDLIDIFNKANSENKRKSVNDRIESVALGNIKNVKNETDAKALQNLINKINTEVTIGKNLKDFLITLLNECCKKNSIPVKNMNCSSPRRRASFFLKEDL
jgi:hypothetical protein